MAVTPEQLRELRYRLIQEALRTSGLVKVRDPAFEVFMARVLAPLPTGAERLRRLARQLECNVLERPCPPEPR